MFHLRFGQRNSSSLSLFLDFNLPNKYLSLPKTFLSYHTVGLEGNIENPLFYLAVNLLLFNCSFKSSFFRKQTFLLMLSFF